MENQLWKFREEEGLSQKALAEQLGVRRATLSKIENNQEKPRLELAWDIAEFFGVYIEDVFWFVECDE